MRSILLIALLPVFLNAQTLTKFQWSDCGSPAVDIYEVDITPMPIVQPGAIDLIFRSNFKRAMRGGLTTTLAITRTVSGLKLPIRCYLAAGIYVGSCTYDDLCKIIESLLPSFSPETCPPTVAQYGIDCNCPFQIKTGLIDIEEHFDVPDATQTIASFLASGDFEIKIDTKDANGAFGCVNIKFAVKPFKP
ncbi:unnamed protein product [Brachionus calyciflorus]|uniref:MD-2-related lipid-recognition domain-containing protein n=1 Tax=Brachionus calyciflorus TaxID=104777 RepID=A0A813NH94_9BILA|nr:unnamed protein product [Brachionus calyciflorus]